MTIGKSVSDHNNHSSLATHWNDLYQKASGKLPWEVDETPSEIQHWARVISPGFRVLDLGCGRGANARHFAGLGFPVTGIDFSVAAITEARASAERLGLDNIEFMAADVLRYRSPRPFDFVYDYSVLHHISDADLTDYVNTLMSTTRTGSLYGLVCYAEMVGGGSGTRVGTLGNSIRHRTREEVRRILSTGLTEVEYHRSKLGPSGAHAAHHFLFRRI
ncbi:class I SAM-dependent methyltransferase [Actinoplanes philippinensis]|uniref:class I SAM-dependent methyltransferase n=1 Tax=Actinoplanes philippinensis TaxID=35752 RepID=UPI0033FDC7F9